jgi:hypothetical protein
VIGHSWVADAIIKELIGDSSLDERTGRKM